MARDVNVCGRAELIVPRRTQSQPQPDLLVDRQECSGDHEQTAESILGRRQRRTKMTELRVQKEACHGWVGGADCPDQLNLWRLIMLGAAARFGSQCAWTQLEVVTDGHIGRREQLRRWGRRRCRWRCRW